MGEGVWNRKRIIAAVVSVVVLAAVIFAAAALSKPETKVAAPVQPTPQQSANKLADDAAEAASAGETQTALSLAERALKLDSSNATAAAVIDSIETVEEPDSSSSTSGSTGGSTPPPDDAYAKAMKPSKLLPKSVAGYSAGTIQEVKADAALAFEPVQSSDAYDQVARVLVSVHDRGSASKAAAFPAAVDKPAYPKNSAKVKVGVVPAAYFGTDGERYAVVAFSRGRYAFEVIVAVKPGTTPQELKGLATKFAAALPAAR